MAKAHYAVYAQGTTFRISPDAVIVSKKAGKVLIRNYTDMTFAVSGSIAGTLNVDHKKAKPFSLTGLAEDVYTFDVAGKHGKHARAHSSPVLIIDG